MYQKLLIVFAICIAVIAAADDATSGNKRGIFDDKSHCELACTGDHDVGCSAIKGNGPQNVCRCASTFYSVDQTCQDECENNQYWSLFTYGSCSEYTSTVLPGVCNKQCVFKVRVWTTVFIIICFTAAVIIIFTTLPMCIINCIACLRVRKQGRAIEDMHVAGEIGTGSKTTAAHQTGAAHQMAAATSPYHNYPYYAGYYSR